MPTKNNKKEIVPLFFNTYLAVIKNSIGSNLFRNFYVKVGDEQTDIMRNGELSCAFYVSSVLALFKFIKEVHGTVDSTVKDLQESDWEIIKEPKIGSILVWEKIDFGDNDIHKHIGFFVGDNTAISNNYKLGYPTSHNWNFNDTRRVDVIFWNQKILSENQPFNSN